MIKGLRTALYAAPDLEKAKAWYGQVLERQPYFDQPFYVGYEVGGFELGLVPDAQPGPGPGGTVAYWGVDDAEKAYERLLALGGTADETVHDVGGDIKVGTVRDPFGNVFGVIENPHFDLSKVG